MPGKPSDRANEMKSDALFTQLISQLSRNTGADTATIATILMGRREDLERIIRDEAAIIGARSPTVRAAAERLCHGVNVRTGQRYNMSEATADVQATMARAAARARK